MVRLFELSQLCSPVSWWLVELHPPKYFLSALTAHFCVLGCFFFKHASLWVLGTNVGATEENLINKDRKNGYVFLYFSSQFTVDASVRDECSC